MPYFAQVPEDVIHDHSLSLSARVVFAEVDLRCGSRAWKLRFADIAEATGISARTVSLACRELVNAGHLNAEKTVGGFIFSVPYRGGNDRKILPVSGPPEALATGKNFRSRSEDSSGPAKSHLYPKRSRSDPVKNDPFAHVVRRSFD